MSKRKVELVFDARTVQVRLEELVATEKALPTDGTTYGYPAPVVGPLLSWASNVITIARSVLGPEHFQVKLLQNTVEQVVNRQLYPYEGRQAVAGVLGGLKADFDGGYLRDLQGQIRIDVEADFLAQAQRFLDDKLKDAAAMVIGAVLEDSLRQLCQKHGIPAANNISTMNADLSRANIYNKNQWGMIDSWARFRNSAAHGKFGEYQQAQIELMHQGVAQFIQQYLP